MAITPWPSEQKQVGDLSFKCNECKGLGHFQLAYTWLNKKTGDKLLFSHIHNFDLWLSLN